MKLFEPLKSILKVVFNKDGKKMRKGLRRSLDLDINRYRKMKSEVKFARINIEQYNTPVVKNRRKKNRVFASFPKLKH